MRPPASVVFAVNSNGAFGQLIVDSAGDVGPDVGSSAIFNLDGVSFTVD